MQEFFSETLIFSGAENRPDAKMTERERALGLFVGSRGNLTWSLPCAILSSTHVGGDLRRSIGSRSPPDAYCGSSGNIERFFKGGLEMRRSFWMVVLPWIGFLSLSVYVVAGLFKEKDVNKSKLELYTAKYPEIGKHYKVLEPITPGMLRYILLLDRDKTEMETMYLRSMLKAGRSGDLTNMYSRMEHWIKDNDKGMKFLEEAIRDPFGSDWLPRTKDKDILCCFWFEHPSLVDCGFLVIRDGKIVYRDPANVYFSDELEEIGFESEINEL